MPDSQPATLNRSLQKMIAAKPITFFNARVLHHLDKAVYRLSGKRTTFTAAIFRLPIITLTTTGAKSGLPRTLPLIGIRDSDQPGTLAVIASNYGQPQSPAWFFNLKANPQASGTIRGKTVVYVAHEATGEEYDRLWQLAVNTYAGYSVYKTRAANRHIPIMVLVPSI
jgi:deazaflavin-dependent oxidoreductase (nitroreductase family)